MFFRKDYSDETFLVKQCLKGDAQAQRYLYEKHAPRFLSICQRYLRQEAAAEDALMEGFTRIFARLADFKGAGSFEGWMRKIIVNAALMQLRKERQLLLEVLPEDTEAIDPAGALPTPDLSELACADILRLIDSLPVGYRTVFNLYAIEGYSHAEISTLLGISTGTSKSQLNRARTWLQQKVRAQEQPLKQRAHG
ncbi:ECF subfamily RNA polymerase sigma-24 subunit [Nitritalea halalkaliphila LW7]|uniref:ECF subfamily RNA polymerase sigma-24 subunit n=1 Tax=Nitritalea halalkaliphila LW7 TaxID=1189621 RepID=I5C095_9BACT|nr:sigma-70 family RNA polymerase sigma factor [Nitritalea halalkaliphila]EIM75247.1 ECF subfamily RNA polymerase sigma-24 subunit [Nitritalea halalkaliphila LW7]